MIVTARGLCPIVDVNSRDRVFGGVTGAQKLVVSLSFGKVSQGSSSAAKADTPLALLCPINTMAPVLAIAGMVANAVRPTASLTPLGRFLNLSSPGRTRS